ncbi:hypothetical protein Pmar_PMAR004732 [Perkinsus marinus ATCC 50983]|uniref:Uncharacterized protein n=1 Tax=Perkinsus marinus (strain ATCC 50983 / TXsc) TaxID=423536 RepID=C5KF78_PERM5|nr:hypothetical protein Pmar_PMAR004732 [Perkinsus marinus ATCC 50983]EER16880.1 hypothetical protein Pmar_PMAR004732 [Perkinsus marinus ATCC 50983]|eukprot:XP_002785084.1 hypothetical protein Pmar_PMAR004732 [Perkinsus marinus ATCC 50983]
MLVNAGFMSGAGVKAIVPALIANTVWVGGEFGSLFLTSPWWAKTALYTTSLGFGVVPLIWYIGCRLRDISKSHGDRELAGRFRLIADLTVVTLSLYPVAWLLTDGLGIVNAGTTSYATMMSGLDLLSNQSFMIWEDVDMKENHEGALEVYTPPIPKVSLVVI